jgi:hypothetical protein
MNLVGIVGEEGEPNVVVLCYGSSEATAVNIPDLEVFEKATLPTGLNRHVNPP